MCGILLHYNPINNGSLEDEIIEIPEGSDDLKSCSDKSPIFNEIVPYIARRGPNYQMFRVFKSEQISWYSSILSLRKPFTKQSIEVNDRYILQFNGELYNNEIHGISDTTYFVNCLKTALDEKDIINILRTLEGEFAYTIFDSKKKLVYFGRDTIGKRSLGYKLDYETNELYISSATGDVEGFKNCVGGIVYIYNIEKKQLDEENMIREPYTVSAEVDEGESRANELIAKLYDSLYESVEKRVLSIHPAHIEASPVAVLFSGGLDCSVIVALICEVMKSKSKYSNHTIELLNVGFENPRVGLQPKDAPDRKLAVSSTEVLKELYPEIDIKLVEVDVSYEEYVKLKPYVIKLMYPKVTEMDLSIAIAFYFASRGAGFITNYEEHTRIPYKRKGIVLFSGLGADELYGGYHKFANKSREELVEELTKQINNIHDRNLNRDDKVSADNGIEVRYPFLDEYVVNFSTKEIPINYKINKKILRDLAKAKLHLEAISEEPKRAIQFGAKSAKMTKDGNKHGTDIIKLEEMLN
ncbi:hypothetical protein TPHA_0C04950 [Tetrapisispora phaffii CBS 4417]|uniref:Asparagine synthase (glutamine-hydrolyzing) n=1 Tax=Tetrapisispora phaffii (strain ATCC 24235 / CBS 4417 / NBRC 1672 / NRRL Y-8282 / UCD 70-5) TaxID=1071381 RepID=G8BQY1_TETPH|nr:hypothetical protein TPHA_0C04950 [Tetrapisispora phaffii CBS 4417]CCE62643.1 hypothetical protein TPHA_0C04950 [Tetrapisispora phaffii CBS 4417]